MAAGRKGVLRRSQTYEYSSRKNASSDVQLCGGKEEREEGEIFVEHAEYANPHPEKRRKISPIVWDMAEKEASVSSKRKFMQGSYVSPSPPSHPRANDQGVLSASSPKSSYADEESGMQGWNVKMSRWASDGLSPTVDDGKQKKGHGSSGPEIDEFQRGSSESTITRSTGSCGRDHGDAGSENEFLVDSDVEEQSHFSVSPSDSHENGGSMPAQRNMNMLQSCRSVCEFEMIKKINEGTYGVVYKARDKKTGKIVALKKVKMNIQRDGFPLSALREMNILLSCNHPSIVDVKEVVVDDYDGTFMVMEYMEYDLKGVMEIRKQPFSIGEIKSLMLQLLEGVKYLHDNWILHRDLKTSNILLNCEGRLKICDLGLSRQYGSPLKPYTPVVVTLWYRAPELLLGTKVYSTAIDMWSVGCIMAELVAKQALFSAKNEIQQLDQIFRTLGTPNEKIWPGLSKLPGYKANFVKQPYNLLRKKFPAKSFTGSPVLSESGFDLMTKLLTYNPEKRITAEDALLHDWFHEAPLPNEDFKIILPSWNC